MKQKTIRATIILGEGEFEDGTNTRVIEGLAITVDVTKNGLPEKHSAKIEIFNMALADMEKLTFLSFLALESRKNKILIEAGEKGGDLSVVFKGDITSAFADFSGAPDITFKIEAITAGWSVQMGTSPTSVNGSMPAADLIRQFATEAGFGFINEGVSDSVQNATYNGSPVTKAQAVADEIGAELLIDDENMTLLPWDKTRGEAVVVSANSGMIGYPSFNGDGIECDCFYNPKLQLAGQIKVESIVPKATGYWKIIKLTHRLSAYTSGEWKSHIAASWIGEGGGEDAGEE